MHALEAAGYIRVIGSFHLLGYAYIHSCGNCPNCCQPTITDIFFGKPIVFVGAKVFVGLSTDGTYEEPIYNSTRPESCISLGCRCSIYTSVTYQYFQKSTNFLIHEFEKQPGEIC